MEGRNEVDATSKNTVSVPVTKPTAKSCQMVRTPPAYAAGIEHSAAARPRSPAIMIGRRRGTRSIQTPAGSATRMSGTESATPSAATSSVVAFSVAIATKGSARKVIWLPSSLTVAADHRRT